MAFGRSSTQLQRDTFSVLFLIVMLCCATTADSRPVISGWDLSVSAGSSDTTLWRKFYTTAQAVRYHRLLLGLETSLPTRQAKVTAKGELSSSFASYSSSEEFNTMDYAFPRSNEPGSSDASTPPAP